MTDNPCYCKPTDERLNPVQADLCIREFEVKHDLLKYQVDGWSAWCILRYPVLISLAYDMPSHGRSWGRYEQILFSAKELNKLLLPKKAKYFVKTCSSGLLEQEGKYYKDIWFDDLIKNLGGAYKLETINNLSFLKRREFSLIKSDLTTTSLNLLPVILRRYLKNAFPEIREIAQTMYTHISAEVGEEYFTPAFFENSLVTFYWQKKMNAWLLDRVTPKYVFVADPGDLPLIAAAKELGIPVAELQHGFVDRYHSAYSWTPYALKYLPQMLVADHFLLYGDFWREELASNGFWGDSLLPVGSTRIDQYRQMKIDRNEDITTVLLTTQGLDTESVIAFMSEFLQIAHSKNHLRLVIKLHPAYESSKEQYAAAFRSDHRVKVFSGNENPSTFNLIKNADLHVSISSTCHYDAVGLGVPTAILPFSTNEIIFPMHQAGHAFLLKEPRDLDNLATDIKDYQIPEAVSTYYFRPNALENIVSGLGLQLL